MAPDPRAERQRALRARLPGAGLAALLITHPPHLRYFTGFSGSAGFLLLAARETILLTDCRYASQAAQEATGWAEVGIEPDDLWARLKTVLRAGASGPLGFESDRLTVRGLERLRAAWDGELTPAAGLVESLRAVKDATEVSAIRRAAHLAADAFAQVVETVRAGDAEVSLAGRLEAALRARGSEGHPFPTLVASGPRSALPHAHPTGRQVRRGELLLLDFGAQVDGYCADLTRTIVVGRADARQREVYQAVQAAQDAALTGLRPGLTGREADALARGVLVAAGFGAQFGHGLGHGLGLEVHEDPRLGRTAQTPLPAGAVVTVEPGVYLEGWGGVRLEEDALLTPGGAHLLSPPARGLVEVG